MPLIITWMQPEEEKGVLISAPEIPGQGLWCPRPCSSPQPEALPSLPADPAQLQVCQLQGQPVEPGGAVAGRTVSSDLWHSASLPCTELFIHVLPPQGSHPERPQSHRAPRPRAG